MPVMTIKHGCIRFYGAPDLERLIKLPRQHAVPGEKLAGMDRIDRIKETMNAECRVMNKNQKRFLFIPHSAFLLYPVYPVHPV